MNGSTVSGVINFDLSINNTNLLEKNWLTVKLPNKTILDNETFQYDTRTLQNGQYYIEAIAKDKAENIADEKIAINVYNSAQNATMPAPATVPAKSDQDFITLTEIFIGIVIASLISIITFKKIGFLRRS